MEPKKIKMLLPDDVIYKILLWLPAISLLRLKLACRSWRAWIESSSFIKKHHHLHHYDPSLKDKNHNLIYLVSSMRSPITFPLTSIDGFEEPNIRLQLNCSELHGCFPVKVLDIVSYNGIVCLSLFNCKREHSICLWNPATKQTKVLPKSPFPDMTPTTVGFGFDVKSNDYKVVKLFGGYWGSAKVYSLNTSSWRSVTPVFSFSGSIGNPRMPFNNGTSFFWQGYSSSENKGIICFDFSSETFRPISFPVVDYFPLPLVIKLVSVVHDKIACVLRANDHQTEIWVLDEYGTVNESWTKLYTVDDKYSKLDRWMPIEWLSTNGKYIFFVRMGQAYRFNVVTKETSCFKPKNIYCSFEKTMVEFKGSLVSFEEGNNAAPICS